tara:strand:+ start:710 stop:1084 length:375 start_codon:yes stop_codon:yes gene_type:complete
MNIFEFYREQIISLIKDLNNKSLLKISENLNNINVDVPPIKFDGDISSNVAMVLSKLNQKSPKDIAQLIINKFKNDKNIENITVVNPGFINIKFKKLFWSIFLTNVINNYKSYGINLKQKKKII